MASLQSESPILRRVTAAVLSACLISVSAPTLLLADTLTARQRLEQNVLREKAKADKMLEARGWKNLNTHATKILSDPSPARPAQIGIALDAVTGEWWSWDDGNPWTWEGTVYVYGPTGDMVVYNQQVDFSNPEDPQMLVNDRVGYVAGDVGGYADASTPKWGYQPAGLQSRTCNPPQCMQGAPRVTQLPDWKNYYKCSAKGCGVAAVLAFIPGFGVAAFFGICTAALINCAFGRVFEYDDLPHRR